ERDAGRIAPGKSPRLLEREQTAGMAVPGPPAEATLERDCDPAGLHRSEAGGTDCQAGQLSLLAPQLCDAATRVWDQRANDPGFAGPSQSGYDAALHP